MDNNVKTSWKWSLFGFMIIVVSIHGHLAPLLLAHGEAEYHGWVCAVEQSWSLGVWEGMRRKRGGRRRRSWRSRRNREREGRKEERPQTKCSCPKICSSNKVPPPTISTNRTPTPPQAIVKTNFTWSNPSKLLIPQTCCVGDWPFNTWVGLDTSNPDFNNSGTHEKYCISHYNKLPFCSEQLHSCVAVEWWNCHSTDPLRDPLSCCWPCPSLCSVTVCTTLSLLSTPYSISWRCSNIYFLCSFRRQFGVFWNVQSIFITISFKSKIWHESIARTSREMLPTVAPSKNSHIEIIQNIFISLQISPSPNLS